MYNSDIPLRAELPTSKQLFRSTVIAALIAAGLLVTVVLPAEYGVDPTGIGRALRLTQMGEIKTRLAAEAAADAAKANAGNGSATATAAAPASAKPASVPVDPPSAGAQSVKAAADQPSDKPAVSAPWRDEVLVVLKPGQGAEVKLSMKEGEQAQFSWTVEGGVVNHDTHGDGGGRSLSYSKGRGIGADHGGLTAAFTGSHGWFWRNRGEADVKVTLRTRGQYANIKRAM